VREVVERELRRRTWSDPDVLRRLEVGLERVGLGVETPYSVARGVLDALRARPGERDSEDRGAR
jgi:hypothetical protein